jgi:hypothetical protein
MITGPPFETGIRSTAPSFRRAVLAASRSISAKLCHSRQCVAFQLSIPRCLWPDVGRQEQDRQRAGWQRALAPSRARESRSPERESRAQIVDRVPLGRRPEGRALDLAGQPIVFDAAPIGMMLLEAQHGGETQHREPAGDQTANSRGRAWSARASPRRSSDMCQRLPAGVQRQIESGARGRHRSAIPSL